MAAHLRWSSSSKVGDRDLRYNVSLWTELPEPHLSDAPASRASLNSLPAAETWEKSLTSLTVYVFHSQGNLVCRSVRFTSRTRRQSRPTRCAFAAGNDVRLLRPFRTIRSRLLRPNRPCSRRSKPPLRTYNGHLRGGLRKPRRKRAGAAFVLSASASTNPSPRVRTAPTVAMALRRTVAKLSVQTNDRCGPPRGEKYSRERSPSRASTLESASQSPSSPPQPFVPAHLDRLSTQARDSLECPPRARRAPQQTRTPCYSSRTLLESNTPSDSFRYGALQISTYHDNDKIPPEPPYTYHATCREPTKHRTHASSYPNTNHSSAITRQPSNPSVHNL